jgi:two-component system nitrogen regulation sensor histidine kinase NtrY
MASNRFILVVIIRIALLFGTLVIWASIFLRADLFFNQIILAILTTIQLLSLIRYISRTNLEISRFLDSIRDSDYTIRMGHLPKDPSFDQLNKSFGGLISKLAEQETEKNAQNLFLKALIEDIPFGLLVLEENGDLRLINKQATVILDVPDIRKWENLKSDRTHLLYSITKLSTSRPHLIEHQDQQLSVSISVVSIQSNSLKIVTIKNIQTELLKKETDAWHKLIRVLTHEIMNSVTPISSIIETIRSILNDKTELRGDTLEDIKEATDTIYSRSTGILEFVKKYRELSKIPQPQIAPADIIRLIQRVILLMSNQRPDISIRFENESHLNVLIIRCDESQIEQVMINLLKNAQEASENSMNQSIILKLMLSGDELAIDIIDNGKGISGKQLERIFIPFYTTKKEGSGIGLGLCRQIIQNHHGSLACVSRQNPTIFSLKLPLDFSKTN